MLQQNVSNKLISYACKSRQVIALNIQEFDAYIL